MYKTVNGRRIKYRYAQNGWKDQLTELSFSINGKEKTERFEYDALGNPTLYRGQQMTWQGRRLKSYDTVDGLIEYTYDVNGIRTSKTRNGVTYNFIYDGNNLVAEQRTDGSVTQNIYYLYGVDGIVGFRYNEQTYLYRKNVQGDVTHIYTEDGEQVGHYTYDAWGNAQILQDKNGIAELNPFRYRSYYFDEETGFYYLQTRYYDSELGRFISADSIEYLDPETLGGLNLYAYCNNNPVMSVDPLGSFWDTVFDLGFIAWDIYDLCTNEGYKDWKNWVALGVDVLFAAIPFVTGGGQIVKISKVTDKIMDVKKVTIIGESMNRVKDTAMIIGHLDDLYDGFKLYNKLENIGKGGKVLAEIGGKISNMSWLYSKLRKGYKIVDIGIDIGRVGRSSSYIAERILVTIWKYRNLWKWSYHLFRK